MFGIEYISQSSYNILAIITALFVMIVGSITDFQKREVADWINYGLFFSAIAIRLLYSAITLNPYILLEGFIGFALFTAFGMGMFYAGQWGGGDTKMIIGLGTLFGLKIIPFELYNIANSILVSFIVNSIIVGSIYGILWSFYMIWKNKKTFIANWKTINKDFHIYKITIMPAGIILIALGIFIQEMTMILFPLGILCVFMTYSFIYTKSIEKGCMVKMYPPSKVTEGDWIDRVVNVKGKYICGPKDLGISKKQIALLKKLKVKKVPVKIGMPFVPCFLMGLIATFFFGNLVILLLEYLFR